MNLRPLGETRNLCGLPGCPFENGGQSPRCGRATVAGAGCLSQVLGAASAPGRGAGGGAPPGHRRGAGARDGREAVSEEPGAAG